MDEQYDYENLPSGIFSSRDIEVLRRFGDRLRSLADGTREPTSAAERRFVEEIEPSVLDDAVKPVGESAIIWLRYQAYLSMVAHHHSTVQHLTSERENTKRMLLARISNLENELKDTKAPLQKEIEQLKGWLKNAQAELSRLKPKEKTARRECQCRGANANCNYCGGSGWVD